MATKKSISGVPRTPGAAGMGAAYRMLAQMERGRFPECDPVRDAWDHGAPFRNLVHERLTALTSDEDREAFCLVLTGTLAIVNDGAGLCVDISKQEIAARLAHDAALSAARDDAAVRRLLARRRRRVQ